MSSSVMEQKDATVNQEGGRNEADRATGLVKEYDGDLNIILILAGLFSTVTSTFTIYIHPQLQRDNNKESADLLRVIPYKMDSTAFGGDIPEVPKRASGTPPAVVVVLVLLYLSLAVTTASVLFAILAKQILYLYALAAASESDTEEGQDQQHKLKRFTTISCGIVFLLFSLLQSALLLLACALIVHIWKINHVISSLILYITICSVPVYFVFVLLVLANIGIIDLSPLQRVWGWVTSRLVATPEGHHEKTP